MRHEIEEKIKNSLLLEMAVGYSGNYSGFVEKFEKLETLEEVAKEYCNENSGKPMCDAFAVRYKNKWYWDDGEEVRIETVPITAWRYNDDAFGL